MVKEDLTEILEALWAEFRETLPRDDTDQWYVSTREIGVEVEEMFMTWYTHTYGPKPQNILIKALREEHDMSQAEAENVVETIRKVVNV